ncbi:hypothetical protein ECE50_022040 [Chitinophaga sp. Mgbs1]|uniref:Uncharacterized protein n=1 Tax=Chitinophaga solisilvae TaxID=1233460 RepID=A0A433WAL7_9BACT|nr:hypothetical protein [Chitinophaga solisilvae]
MKRILLLLSAAALFSCNQSSRQEEAKDSLKEDAAKLKEDLKSAAGNAGDYLDEQKKQATEAINERIKQIDQTADELKKEGTEKSKTALKELEELKVEMNKKMKDIKSSSADAWDSTRKATDELMRKSDKEWTEFKQNFKDLFKKD